MAGSMDIGLSSSGDGGQKPAVLVHGVAKTQTRLSDRTTATWLLACWEKDAALLHPFSSSAFNSNFLALPSADISCTCQWGLTALPGDFLSGSPGAVYTATDCSTHCSRSTSVSITWSLLNESTHSTHPQLAGTHARSRRTSLPAFPWKQHNRRIRSLGPEAGIQAQAAFGSLVGCVSLNEMI